MQIWLILNSLSVFSFYTKTCLFFKKTLRNGNISGVKNYLDVCQSEWDKGKPEIKDSTVIYEAWYKIM